MSNALVVSGKHTATGNPVAVFGPQTGYFAPQLLMLQELQGPGISAPRRRLRRPQPLRPARPRPGLRLERHLRRPGHHRHLRRRAVRGPAASPRPSPRATCYRGKCTPMEKLEQHNAWKPTIADSTAAGSYDVVTSAHRATAWSATPGHVGRQAGRLHRPALHLPARGRLGHRLPDVQRPVGDHVRDAASRRPPGHRLRLQLVLRRRRTDRLLQLRRQPGPCGQHRPEPADPGRGRRTSGRAGTRRPTPPTYTPPAEHPQSVNQDYYVSWNNKQAKRFSAGWGNGSVHRGDLLDERGRRHSSSRAE